MRTFRNLTNFPANKSLSYNFTNIIKALSVFEPVVEYPGR